MPFNELNNSVICYKNYTGIHAEGMHAVEDP